ncbi:hypothetical protein RI054_23g98110 [Pseudoscourfieldia marina]
MAAPGKLPEQRERLRACPDFENERTALQTLVEDRGHLLVMGVKGHCEFAGLGIEYTWGYSKRVFRLENDCEPAHLRENVETSLSKMNLPLSRIRRFARRARTYRRAYKTDEHSSSYELIQKFVKESKTHRSALDLDYGFIESEIAATFNSNEE